MTGIKLRVQLIDTERHRYSNPHSKANFTPANSVDEHLSRLCRPTSEDREVDSEEGPPKKRQRITKDDEFIETTEQTPKYVILADTTLVLTAISLQKQKQKQDDVAALEHPVFISGCSRLDPEDETMQFTLSHGLQSLRITNATKDVHTLLHWASVIHDSYYQRCIPPVAPCTCVLIPPTTTCRYFKLRVKIKWRTGVSAVAERVKGLGGLLAAYLPDPFAKTTPWTPQDFYENVHVPDRDHTALIDEKAIGLATRLYPFQERAVKWLLGREGVRLSNDGRVEPISQNADLICFDPVLDAAGQACYVSHLQEEVVLGSPYDEDQINGGILAEEMGLGKTVELIALILLHKREMSNSTIMADHYTGNMVVPSSATLIITPPTILEQWMSELQNHAPELKVMHYQGVKHSKMSDEALKEMLLEQDVVLTTYGVLGSEIHYAEEKPERNLRQAKKYERRRTPLVQISWWRVCLDEAQMVESGVSNAAKVAKLIPRHNAWAVSGTPLKKDVKDLLGLLIFLRYAPFCYPNIWNRLIKDHKRVFAKLVGHIAMRHTKASITEELRLPSQKRVVISVPFTAIEEQNYSHLFQQMCDDCGLDAEGAPLRGDWDPTSSSTVEKMRSWLTRLRQTCLHAEIGVRNRRALGKGSGPLRTIEEVLEVLIDQNETALRAEERAVLTSKIAQGHISSFGKDREAALEIYLEALKESTIIVEGCRVNLAGEQHRVEQNKAALRAEDIKKGQRPDSDEDEDGEDVEESAGRVNVARQWLRSALETQHVCAFYLATAYFQLKESLSPAKESTESTNAGADSTETQADRIQELEKQESTAYEQAKAIRKELLAEVAQKTTQLISRVANSKAKTSASMPIIEVDDEIRGIESRKIFETVRQLADIMNEQEGELSKYRAKLVDLLTIRLLDQDEEMEMTGEEYETSTKQQDEQYVFHEALRAAHADRHGMITGEINLLINIDMSTALKLAVSGSVIEPDNKGPAPEIMVAMLGRREKMLQSLQMLSKRNNLPPTAQISIRGIIADVRSMLTSLQWQEGGRSNRAAVEATILERELEKLQIIASQQVKALAGLEKEIDLYRSTMNSRLEFYRQLQQISDTVAPLQEAETDDVDTERLVIEQRKESHHAEKLAGYMTKRRFLSHLRTESSVTHEQRICVICQSTFEIGVLTVCGHQYCKECIGLWWRSKGTCPTCKRPLKVRDFHEITYKPQSLQLLQEEHHDPSSSGSPRSSTDSTPNIPTMSIYTSISPTTLSSIKSINLRNKASYGTKIDTIARHLLYLRASDPGCKSIIFSQYRDFLSVLGSAFDAFRIGHTSIGAKKGIARFREDASIECFLMHAKADSSGLNLVNATHVFLCEPLINAALELQAIARVHRIGQRRQTTVWMYLVSDTVEQAIYDISVSRRLAHMQQRRPKQSSRATSASISRATTPGVGTLEERQLDAANSMELQQAPMSKLLTNGQSGGEVVEANDLWNCLFGGRAGRRAASAREDGIGMFSGDAEREVGRFLRAEAAEGRST